nr:hypothetical protein [Tanacetum cinerariifolium]
MFKSFDREDFKDLYKSVKARYESTRLVDDLDLLLWGDLKTMFEPHVEDKVRREEVSSYTTYTFNDIGKEASSAHVEEGESSRSRALYVPEWIIHQRCRVDSPMWCQELMVREEHDSYASKLQVLEREKDDLSCIKNDQAIRIKELEAELAKKDFALVYAERISAERAAEKEKLVKHMAIQAERAKGLAEERSEEDITDALHKAPAATSSKAPARPSVPSAQNRT